MVEEEGCVCVSGGGWGYAGAGVRRGRAAALAGGAYEGAGGALPRAALSGSLWSAQRGATSPKAP